MTGLRKLRWVRRVCWLMLMINSLLGITFAWAHNWQALPLTLGCMAANVWGIWFCGRQQMRLIKNDLKRYVIRRDSAA